MSLLLIPSQTRSRINTFFNRFLTSVKGNCSLEDALLNSQIIIRGCEEQHGLNKDLHKAIKELHGWLKSTPVEEIFTEEIKQKILADSNQINFKNLFSKATPLSTESKLTKFDTLVSHIAINDSNPCNLLKGLFLLLDKLFSLGNIFDEQLENIQDQNLLEMMGPIKSFFNEFKDCLQSFIDKALATISKNIIGHEKKYQQDLHEIIRRNFLPENLILNQSNLLINTSLALNPTQK